MGGQDDLLTSLRAIMAARREELGEPPTPEELLAYRDGRLGPEERQRIEERIAVHPDAARALADLASFPEVTAAPGTPELSEEEIGTSWRAFRERLADLPAPEVPPKVEPGAAPVLTLPPRARRWLPAGQLAAAAIALTVAGAGSFLAGRASREVPEGAINVRIAELAPERETGERGTTEAVGVASGAEALVLILGAPAQEGFADYGAEILDAAGARVWARRGLRPTPLGTFHLSFHQGTLDPGLYRIRLFGVDGQRTPLATYELRLLDEPERR